MKLSKRSWHTRVYLWWCSQKYDTPKYMPDGGIKLIPRAERPVNLCPYVRTVLFYAPLRWTFLTGKKAWFSWLALVALLHWLAYLIWGEKAFRFDEAVGILAGLVAVLGTIGWIASLVKDGAQNSDVLRSFGSVVAARYSSVHDKVCPVVELVDE